MKKIALTLSLLACSLLGTACSPDEEEGPKGPVTPTATMKPATDPALANVERRSDRKKADVATAIVPAEKTEVSSPTPTP
jgi:hypothetical protein